jgi:hypothetical protein
MNDIRSLEQTLIDNLPWNKAGIKAHQQFREDIESGEAPAVTQNEILDAQVFAEAAHRSAQYAGARYRLQRYDDWQEYKASCIVNGLIDNETP